MSMIARRMACVAVVACSLVTTAQAQEGALANIIVTQAWSRATPGGSKVAGGYLTVENRGVIPDKLLSASTDAARKIEIHEMAVTDGVMTMRPVEGGLTIEPGHNVKFAPGGLHLMIVGLVAPLKQGDQVPASLTFEKAGTISVSFEVQGMGAQAPGPLNHTATVDPPVKP